MFKFVQKHHILRFNFWQCPENNPEEISVWQSNTALPPDFFSKFYFDLKLPKVVFKRGTLVLATAIYQTNCPFTVLSALFCSSGRCPMILDYSLMSIYFMLYDHLAVSITVIYEVMVCPISFDTSLFYLISHIYWREIAFWLIFLRNLLWSISL